MANQANEKIKRRYFKLLKGAKGFSDQTIACAERAIHQFEESTQFKDFKTFCERQATGFKKWLDEHKYKGRPLSNTTKYHQLRHVHAFFTWLASQQGYRSRISLDAISYLTMDRKTVHEVLSPRPKRFPSLEQVKQLVGSVQVKTEMDRRDRALIAFLLLTGIRYRAACSLSLGCFDCEKLVVYQDPRMGVKTKGGKVITTRILRFDSGLVEVVKDWVLYLTNERHFGPSDPLFPRNRVSQALNGYSFEVKEVEPVFWGGGNSIREILKARSAEAGLPYFNPHSYRHAACQLGLKGARTPEEFKALSQNFGHEEVMTTLKSYGTLDQERVGEVIAGIDFSEDRGNCLGAIPASDLVALLRNRNIKLD